MSFKSTIIGSINHLCFIFFYYFYRYIYARIINYKYKRFKIFYFKLRASSAFFVFQLTSPQECPIKKFHYVKNQRLEGTVFI